MEETYLLAISRGSCLQTDEKIVKLFCKESLLVDNIGRNVLILDLINMRR
jgi:hypothetical protein